MWLYVLQLPLTGLILLARIVSILAQAPTLPQDRLIGYVCQTVGFTSPMEIRSRGYVQVYVLSTTMLIILHICAKLNVLQVLTTMLTTPPEDVC